MKKILFGVALIISSTILMAENINESTVDQEFQSILMEEKKTLKEFKLEKKILEKDLVDLEKIMSNKSKMVENLKRDAEIRWHRDKYKILLKEYEHYYIKIEEEIKVTKERISELSAFIKAI